VATGRRTSERLVSLLVAVLLPDRSPSATNPPMSAPVTTRNPEVVREQAAEPGLEGGELGPNFAQVRVPADPKCRLGVDETRPALHAFPIVGADRGQSDEQRLAGRRLPGVAICCLRVSTKARAASAPTSKHCKEKTVQRGVLTTRHGGP
jgi:hypothetical protein